MQFINTLSKDEAVHQLKSILFISPLPPPSGGIATLTAQLLKFGLPQHIPVRIIDSKILGSKRNIFDKQQLSIAEIWRNLRIPIALFFHLLYKRPRLVHINSSISSLGILRDLLCASITKLLRIPVVVQYHANMPDFNRSRFAGLSGRALDVLLRIANLNILTNSPSWQLVAGKRHIRSTTLPNPIADQIFDLPSTTPLPHPVRVLTIGGLTKAKGLLEVCALAQANPTIEFHLYGKAQAETNLNDLRALANIYLHDEVSHAQLLNEMTNFHLLLFPSHTEGFPLSILEAMARGLPILASTVGAIPEMVDAGKGGILCAPRDITGFQSALDHMTSNLQALSEMGQYNRRQCFEKFRYSKVSQDLLDCYRKWGL